MKRSALWFTAVVAFLLGLVGCAPVISPPGAYQPMRTGPVAFHEVDHQGRIAVSRVSTEPLVMMCVDPSLEAALAFTNRILGDANGKAAGGNGALHTNVSELATRTQIRLTVLREELARLCVAAAAKLPSQQQMAVSGATINASLKRAEPGFISPTDPQTGARLLHHSEAIPR